MKVLIAYDGSACSDVALEDLRRAGLPREVEARIYLVVQETTECALYPVEALSTPMVWYPMRQPDALVAPAKLIEQMRHLGGNAADKLRHQFPAWTVEIETGYGVPGPLIVDRVKSWKADLVVMGSHGRQGLGRMMLGSVSQHVVNRASCAVRIAHAPVRERPGPIRLLVALDTSPDAAHALRAVASRFWPAGTEARVIGVVNPDVPEQAEAAHHPDEFRSKLAHILGEAASDLRQVGLVASHQVLCGEPSLVILEEAANCKADCIFLGARGVGAIHRLVLGSVSSEVAAHAHCSVEVVRRARLLSVRRVADGKP
jgi:nucleotide-binding universal stress UspA family protein